MQTKKTKQSTSLMADVVVVLGTVCQKCDNFAQVLVQQEQSGPEEEGESAEVHKIQTHSRMSKTVFDGRE